MNNNSLVGVIVDAGHPSKDKPNNTTSMVNDNL